MAATGRRPVPAEVKRRRGNPGRRPLPEPVVALPQATTIPEPLRPLGPDGRREWDRIWAMGRVWISPDSDIGIVQRLCEQYDEYVRLRFLVLRDEDIDERKALRALDKAITDKESLLGLTPTDRTRLGVAEVVAQSALERMRQQRRS